MYHEIDIVSLLQSIRLFHKALAKLFSIRELQKLKDENENEDKNEIQLVRPNPPYNNASNKTEIYCKEKSVHIY